MNPNHKPWTDEDIKFLKENRDIMSNSQMAKKLKRGFYATEKKNASLGLPNKKIIHVTHHIRPNHYMRNKNSPIYHQTLANLRKSLLGHHVSDELREKIRQGMNNYLTKLLSSKRGRNILACRRKRSEKNHPHNWNKNMKKAHFNPSQLHMDNYNRLCTFNKTRYKAIKILKELRKYQD